MLAQVQCLLNTRIRRTKTSVPNHSLSLRRHKSDIPYLLPVQDLAQQPNHYQFCSGRRPFNGLARDLTVHRIDSGLRKLRAQLDDEKLWAGPWGSGEARTAGNPREIFTFYLSLTQHHLVYVSKLSSSGHMVCKALFHFVICLSLPEIRCSKNISNDSSSSQ